MRAKEEYISIIGTHHAFILSPSSFNSCSFRFIALLPFCRAMHSNNTMYMCLLQISTNPKKPERRMKAEVDVSTQDACEEVEAYSPQVIDQVREHVTNMYLYQKKKKEEKAEEKIKRYE